MLARKLGTLFEIVRQILILGIILSFCAFQTLIFNDFIYDYPVSQIIVPQWYQFAISYVIPILVLLSLLLLLQKHLNSKIRNISGALFFVLIIDLICLAFSLPSSVALKMEEQNISNHILSIRDMAGFILLNMCILIGIVMWQLLRKCKEV